MAKALKGKMPRVLKDHRTVFGKRLRAVYDDLAGRFPLQDGVARRIAVLAARAWLDYEDASTSMDRSRRVKGTEANRLRRR